MLGVSFAGAAAGALLSGDSGGTTTLGISGIGGTVTSGMAAMGGTGCAAMFFGALFDDSSVPSEFAAAEALSVAGLSSEGGIEAGVVCSSLMASPCNVPRASVACTK